MSKRLTYASNLLKWRVGCFNIDATRVGGKNGRFCANLILSHTPDCEYLGVTEEEVTINVYDNGNNNHKFLGEKDKEKDTFTGKSSSTKVAKYSCSPDCPCRLMDEQANQGASRFFIQIESEPNE